MKIPSYRKALYTLSVHYLHPIKEILPVGAGSSQDHSQLLLWCLQFLRSTGRCSLKCNCWQQWTEESKLPTKGFKHWLQWLGNGTKLQQVLGSVSDSSDSSPCYLCSSKNCRGNISAISQIHQRREPYLLRAVKCRLLSGDVGVCSRWRAGLVLGTRWHI